MRFAEKLRNLRLGKNLNYTQLGELVGLEGRHISAYERGLQRPRQKTRAKLAEALGVPVEELADGPEDELERKLALKRLQASSQGRVSMQIEFEGRHYRVEEFSRQARERATAMGCTPDSDLDMRYKPLEGKVYFTCEGKDGSFSV